MLLLASCCTPYAVMSRSSTRCGCVYYTVLVSLNVHEGRGRDGQGTGKGKGSCIKRGKRAIAHAEESIWISLGNKPGRIFTSMRYVLWVGPHSSLVTLTTFLFYPSGLMLRLYYEIWKWDMLWLLNIPVQLYLLVHLSCCWLYKKKSGACTVHHACNLTPCAHYTCSNISYLNKHLPCLPGDLFVIFAGYQHFGTYVN